METVCSDAAASEASDMEAAAVVIAVVIAGGPVTDGISAADGIRASTECTSFYDRKLRKLALLCFHALWIKTASAQTVAPSAHHIGHDRFVALITMSTGTPA